jgi:quercetin dioxygenase-like cupin family protein
MKCIVAAAIACSCLVIPAGAQQVVKQILPTPPRGDQLEARLTRATIEPGVVGKWHTYPNHAVVYVVEGMVTVEFRNGDPKVYKAGEGFVEPINTVLRGRNRGRIPVKLVIFQVSPPGVPDAIDAPSE